MISKRGLSLFLILAGLVVGPAVLAQTSANYDLSWQVIASSGGRSSSANYVVNGTIGQSMASPAQAFGANYLVNSGFWYGGVAAQAPGTQRVYLPLILRN